MAGGGGAGRSLSYGDYQGYRPLRELVCQKYELFEGLKQRFYDA